MTLHLDPHRGEVWMVDLNPTRGSEMAKSRPCVIVSAAGIGILPLRIIVPITGWDERYVSLSWMVLIEPDADNGLSKSSAADTFQIRSASLDRFISKLGTLTDDQTDLIASAIALCVDAP